MVDGLVMGVGVFDELQLLIHEWILILCFFLLPLAAVLVEEGGCRDVDGEVVIDTRLGFRFHELNTVKQINNCMQLLPYILLASLSKANVIY